MYSDRTYIPQSKHFRVYRSKSNQGPIKSPWKLKATLNLIDKIHLLSSDGTTETRSRSPAEVSCLLSIDILNRRKIQSNSSDIDESKRR